MLQTLHAIVEMNRRLVPGESAPGKLNEVLGLLGRLARHDSLVAIMSDFAGADEDSRRLATLIARHNDVIAALISDPLEERLPEQGRLTFGSGDRWLEVSPADRPLRRAYEKEFSERLLQARRLLLQRAIPLLTISTAEDPTDQVRRHLGYSGPAKAARPTS